MKNKRDQIYIVLTAVLTSIAITPLEAAVPVTPYQILGHIQKFTLDNGADVFSGGHMTVNGIDVVLPRNTVVQMPAAYLTPQQIFSMAQGVSKSNNESGLALDDKVPPLAAFEAAVDGNIVCNPSCVYIAGLVHISQQSLNMGAGFIKAIDVATGEMRVGNDPVAPLSLADARVRLNDPPLEAGDPFAGDGRYGKPNPPSPESAPDPNSRFPDPRFTVDQGNPTVHALTGYPMCVPRSAADAECPSSNRLIVGGKPANTFVMGSTGLPAPAPGQDPIPPCSGCVQTKQAPFMVGDYITYQGTLAQDAAADEGTKPKLYVSAHAVVANVGIYTAPGVDPAYVSLEDSLVGTMGPISACASKAECQDRIKVEGFTTDPSRTVNVYAVDVNPATGANTMRFLNIARKVQAVFGRVRFIVGKRAGVLFDASGLKGATRELLLRLDNTNAHLPDGTVVPVPPTSPPIAHGLTPRQYVAPVGEYIFPEPVPLGADLPALNFQCLAFLINGWNLGSTGNIGQLSPWPGTTPPVFSCTQ